MTTRKLENDRKTLLVEVLLPSQETLDCIRSATRDEHLRREIDAELGRISTKIQEILDQQIKELTDDMLADPDVQKHMKQIRKGTKEAKEASEAVKQATDKLTAAKNAVDKAIKPIDQLVKFFA